MASAAVRACRHPSEFLRAPGQRVGIDRGPDRGWADQVPEKELLRARAMGLVAVGT